MAEDKHLEVQQGWVQSLVRKKEVEFLRNGGTSEPRGMLTRVVGCVQLQRQMAQLNMKAGIGAKLCGFSLSLSEHLAFSPDAICGKRCSLTSLGDRVLEERCWSPCFTKVRIRRVFPAHFHSWSVRLSRVRATVTKFCTSDPVSSTCSYMCDTCYSMEFYPALSRWLKKKSRAAHVWAHLFSSHRSVQQSMMFHEKKERFRRSRSTTSWYINQTHQR